jgi:electron transfer flavoprotein alpha subunit
MLRTRITYKLRPLLRTYASSAGPNALVFLEHHDGVLDSGSLSAVTAAGQLGGKVTGLITGGAEIKDVIEKAKKLVIL